MVGLSKSDHYNLTTLLDQMGRKLAELETIEAERADLLTRAVTAEQRLDDLRAITQGEDGLNARAFKIMQLKMQIGRLENDNDDLRARVAELEAQLAE